LLASGHKVKVIDLQWFGNYLQNNVSLEIHKKAVEEINYDLLNGVDTVIHLANIANDPSVELNPVLSWEVNTLHLAQLLEKCRVVGVKNFFYASSGSVYGVKTEERVTEDLSLVPISVYNKTKMTAERICLSYNNEMRIVCVRPATVCGYSPRMRFDVVVNMFVLQAFNESRIRVLGGQQVRPNIHIDDMVSVYEHFIINENLEGIFNAGFENVSILEIAKLISEKYGCLVNVSESNDPRSYRQDSTKLLNSGFVVSKTIKDAIDELWSKLKDGSLQDSDDWHTVTAMKKLGLDKVLS
jgi:nucleoside-diphosphate-sugar epimerase